MVDPPPLPSLLRYARIIQKLGFDAKFSEFKIQNIVGSCDVKFPIRLEGLAYSHGSFSSYEPEVRFPFRSLWEFWLVTKLLGVRWCSCSRG